MRLTAARLPKSAITKKTKQKKNGKHLQKEHGEERTPSTLPRCVSKMAALRKFQASGARQQSGTNDRELFAVNNAFKTG